MFMGVRLLSENEVKNFFEEITTLENDPNSTTE